MDGGFLEKKIRIGFFQRDEPLNGIISAGFPEIKKRMSSDRLKNGGKLTYGTDIIGS